MFIIIIFNCTKMSQLSKWLISCYVCYVYGYDTKTNLNGCICIHIIAAANL